MGRRERDRLLHQKKKKRALKKPIDDAVGVKKLKIGVVATDV